MKELQEVLDECLRSMAAGQAGLEDCLALYPEHALQLKPLLRAAGRLARGQQLQPSATFRNSGRVRAIAFARVHSPSSRLWLRPVSRLAVSVAIVVLALLITTTALAQTALPGEPLYFLKRATEEVWRAVAPDPVGADLNIVDRRAEELVIWANARQAAQSANGDNQQPTENLIPAGGRAPDEFEALQGLHLALGRLNADDNPSNQQRIENALKQQQKKLEKAGVHDKVLDDAVQKGKSKNKP